MAEVSREDLAHEIAALARSILADARWREDEKNVLLLGAVLYGFALGLAMADVEAKLRSFEDGKLDVFGSGLESHFLRGTMALAGREAEIRSVLFSHLTDELHAGGKWCTSCLEEFGRIFRENDKKQAGVYDLIKVGYYAAGAADESVADALFDVVGRGELSALNFPADQEAGGGYKGSQKSQAPAHSPTGQGGHVFLSYVREDAAKVNELAEALRRAGIMVWMDRDSIQPGQQWAGAIRQAITDGTYFLACFSGNYFDRDKTYMDEELAIAISELRVSPAQGSWIIPVRLEDVQVPELAVGGGRTLRDIQWVDLFDGWDGGLSKLVQKVGLAKRKPPVSGNAFMLDTSTPVEQRIANAVEYWLGHGRTADGLVNGKAFFALSCWIFNRISPYPKAAYSLTPETREYLDSCKAAAGGDEGWDDLLRDHIACESCRENYRFENISIDTRAMKYYCYGCSPNHADVVG